MPVADGLWDVVDELLQFVDAQEPLERAQLRGLIDLLDRFVVVAPAPDADAFPISDRDPPLRDEMVLRDLLFRRFPQFGFYHQCTLAGIEHAREETTGDALDDVLDISCDLRDARWMREHGEEGDGERYLQQVHFHWMCHVRDLQRHLHWLVYECE